MPRSKSAQRHRVISGGSHPARGVVGCQDEQPPVGRGQPRELAEELGRRGIHMLDAPVSGGEKGAIEGTLSIMVGGEPAVFGACRPIFEALGNNIVHMGPIGAGHRSEFRCPPPRWSTSSWRPWRPVGGAIGTTRPWRRR